MDGFSRVWGGDLWFRPLLKPHYLRVPGYMGREGALTVPPGQKSSPHNHDLPLESEK